MHTMKQILSLLCFLLSLNAHAEYFKHIGMSKGLSQLSVMSIYQDTLGRMWFGTREGINVYDGNTIVAHKAYVENHSKTGSSILIDNEIHTITGDRQGDIFFLAGKSIVKYDISKENFRSITKDEANALISYDGNIWCAVGDDICFYNSQTDSLETFIHTNIKEATWLTLTAERIYIGSKEGLYVVDRRTKETTLLIPDVNIYRVFESSRKEIWVGCRMEGLYRIAPDGTIAKIPYHPDSPDGISSGQIRDFAEDKFHNIWFGTFDGLQKYDYQTGKFSLIRANRNTGGLDHPSIFAVYCDRHGIVWLGSYFGGVNYFNPGQEVFSRYNYDQHADKDLYFSYIGEMTEDNEHNLWIGTDGGGLSRMNLRTHDFTNYRAGKNNTLPHNNIKSICYDSKRDYLYIGTYLGGLSRYDIQKKQFYNYLHNPGKKPHPGNIIYHVAFHNDRLYLSSNNGFYMMDPQTNEFTRLHTNFYCQNFDLDNKGNAWLLVWGSLIRLNLSNPKDVTYIPLKERGVKFRPTKVKVTPQGIYFGSLGSGLFCYHPETQKMVNYTTKNGQLLSDYCYNLALTQLGNLLITSDKGITLFSPINDTFRSIELSADFPSPVIINDCGIYVTSDNEIYIGDIQGLTAFHEEKLKTSGGKRELYFSQLLVNNQHIYPEDETGILPLSLPFIKTLSLKHDQNNITLHFAITNYSDIQQSNHYEYKLEGFDKEWVVARQMALHYTNLDPGKYTLRIRMQNGGFSASAEEISLPIRIASPWYNSLWSWLLYVFFTSLCIAYYIRSRTARKVLALSLEKEQFEKQQIEQMNQAKLLFFTNVSHEFRTPLTLIISHIDQLLQQTGIPPAIYNPVLKIYKNTQQMKNLVSELLDFRKFEQNHVTLKMAQQNLTPFLKEIYYSFFDYAQRRNITFLFTSDDESATCWFDAVQLEKVFFNLLSNAFKYTPDNGQIEVIVTTFPDICIQVKDSGTGIDSSEASHVFDRFYQANSEQKDARMTRGTGIGLALTKSIVAKHQGDIHVESEIGKGSTFIVRLPKEKEDFVADKDIIFLDHVEEKSFIPESLPINVDPEAEPEDTPDINPDKTKHTLLIVEDNEDLLKVLQQLFSPFYKVLIGRNGKEGLELAISEKPTLIISDVMMPEMTGTEMCLQIKNDIDLCHIPVILLTALNTNEQNIQGLNSGADDYITKPFDARILLARCNNLIRNRLLIQRQLNDKLFNEVDLTDINPMDKDLLKEATEIIDAHIDDPQFDIPMLCKEIGMGRTLLYSKFKALTGMTPNNYVLNHKLKRAAALLIKYPSMQIAEISDRLGFGSAVYFTRCFKGQFNDTPQSYRKKNTSPRP